MTNLDNHTGQDEYRQTPPPLGFLKNPIHLLAMGLGSGCLPKAPGTAGTCVGTALCWVLLILPWPVYLGVTVVLFVIGVWLCGVTARDLKVHDHRGIVWDEIVGILIALTAAPRELHFLLLGFILFRFFDIRKPWPINIIDRKTPGGLGIMLDDALAGVYTFAILQIVVYLPNITYNI